MRTTVQRTSVHGAARAAQEWQRIVDVAWRHGLAALPSSRPEFAPPPPAPNGPTGRARLEHRVRPIEDYRDA